MTSVGVCTRISDGTEGSALRVKRQEADCRKLILKAVRRWPTIGGR